jgi:SAM-dependent methyltransferase
MYSDRSAMNPPFSEAAERNKAPILAALLRRLPERGRVLEIGSGTGQHVVHFAPAFPRLSWQPTDQREHLEGLNTRIRLEGSPNILPAIELDVTGPWPDYCFEAVYSSNTAHIMPWDAVQAMFAGVSERIAPRRVFCLYGPFNVDGEFTSASNREFDRQLRERDMAMGLRDVGALTTLAGEHLMRLAERCQLPANNQLLVFRRDERG